MDYIVSPLQPKANMAVEKPKTDTAIFIGQVGFERLQLSRYVYWDDKNWQSQFSGIYSGITPDSVVIYQTPTYAGAEVEEYAVQAAHEKGAKVIGLIHDIEYLRYPTDYNHDSELHFLKSFDGLLVGSRRAREILERDGVDIPIREAGPFGYIQPFEYRRPQFSKTMHYAGNLLAWKAGFLAEVPSGLDIQVYGQNDQKDELDFIPSSSVTLRGSKSQQDLALSLTNGFGLIWDADENLQYSEYMRIAMAHKFSLYMSLGLPVIANTDTAIGEYVDRYNLGFTLEDIKELRPRMNDLTERQYNQYVDRVKVMSDLVRRGRHLQEAALAMSLTVRNAEAL